MVQIPKTLRERFVCKWSLPCRSVWRFSFSWTSSGTGLSEIYTLGSWGALVQTNPLSSTERRKCCGFCHTTFCPVISETLLFQVTFLNSSHTAGALTREGTEIKPKHVKREARPKPVHSAHPTPFTPESCATRPDAPSSAQPLSEQVGQNETRGLWLHAVDPEICAARVVLVPSVRQLKVVRFRIKGLKQHKPKRV